MMAFDPVSDFQYIGLRVLIAAGSYHVDDDVSDSVRELETFLLAQGASVKILTTTVSNVAEVVTQNENIIVAPSIKFPYPLSLNGDYAFGVGLDDEVTTLIEAFNPNCVQLTVPDLVSLDLIRWCQAKNVAYVGTWHSSYIYQLQQYRLFSFFSLHLGYYFQQIPVVFVPSKHVRFIVSRFELYIFYV